jgi:hypothetical protein
MYKCAGIFLKVVEYLIVLVKENSADFYGPGFDPGKSGSNNATREAGVQEILQTDCGACIQC